MDYKQRREENKCVLCARTLDRAGSICIECLDKRRLRRKKLKDSGLCRCGRPRENLEFTNCEMCLSLRRETGKENRETWSREHKCTICGSEVLSADHALCEKCREKDKNYRHTTKVKAIFAYGNKCNCCGEQVFEFLTIDHINGRKTVNGKDTRKGMKLYSQLLTSGYPKDYQVLCYNCNCAKRDFGFCPHQDSRLFSSWMGYKTKVYKKYGGKCICCGEENIYFLTLDHKNGGGSLHRKQLKEQKISIFRWLRENNYPDILQILCFNCNSAKQDGICPHTKDSYQD